MRFSKGYLCRTVTRGLVIGDSVGFPDIIIIGPGPTGDSSIVRLCVNGELGDRFIINDEDILDAPDPEMVSCRQGVKMEIIS